MKLKRAVLAVAIAAMTIVPASPALGTHRCGLEDVDPLVNALCESHGDPGEIKAVINYVACLVSPTC